MMIPIERTIVDWFEAAGHQVEHDGHEWFTWVGGHMLPLSELAVVVKQAIERAGAACR